MILSNSFIRATEEMCDFGKWVPAPYFRKKFQLDFVPEHAEITISGLGFYELYINGHEITKGPLAPYISNTDHICYYDTYNISSLLNKGENVVGVLLGNGFRNPFGGFIWSFHKSTHRGPVTLALCLEADGEGKEFMLEADESFKTAPSPILYDDIRMGYCYDARLEIPGWNLVDFDDSGWQNAQKERTPSGKAKLCEADPIVVTREIPAAEVRHYDELPYAYKDTAPGAEPYEETIRKDVYVYDFGVNSAGLTKLHINGKPGQKITIRHGEHLVDGKFAINTTIFIRENAEQTNNYLKYSQADTFICKGGEETFIPKFKYDGFRYAYVEGLLPEQATEDALVFVEMNSDLKARADFECSDEVLNKLQELTRRADLSNFYYFPTDCPQREKNGWTGDASMSAEHMMLNLSVEKSLREWLANIRAVQSIEGEIPGIVPTGGWGFTWSNGPAWDSVCVTLPYSVYKYTGDRSIIEENVPMIMRYLGFITSERDERGLVAHALGDWVDPRMCRGGKPKAPLLVVDSIMTFCIAGIAAFLFKEVGKTHESNYAKAIAEEMRTNIRKHLVDFDTMTVSGDCQTSQAFALAAGIFSDDELSKAREKLLSIIHRDGDVNDCGMIGSRCLYHVLSDMGESDLAYKIITSKESSCYGYWVENGATSLWESWTPVDAPTVNSRNHHFFGDISRWFIQYLAGIKPNPTAADISHFEISPEFVEALSYAKGEYISPFGKIAAHWKRENGKIALSVTLPPNTRGEIVLRGGYQFDDKNIKKAWEYEASERTLSFVITK